MKQARKNQSGSCDNDLRQRDMDYESGPPMAMKNICTKLFRNPFVCPRYGRTGKWNADERLQMMTTDKVTSIFLSCMFRRRHITNSTNFQEIAQYRLRFLKFLRI